MYTREVVVAPFSETAEYIPYGEVKMDIQAYSDGVEVGDTPVDVHIDDSQGHEFALALGKLREDVGRASGRVVNNGSIPNSQYEDWELTLTGFSGIGTDITARAFLQAVPGRTIELELTKQNPDTAAQAQLGINPRPIEATPGGWQFFVSDITDEQLHYEQVHRAYYARRGVRLRGPAVRIINNNAFPVRIIAEITLIDEAVLESPQLVKVV